MTISFEAISHSSNGMVWSTQSFFALGCYISSGSVFFFHLYLVHIDNQTECESMACFKETTTCSNNEVLFFLARLFAILRFTKLTSVWISAFCCRIKPTGKWTVNVLIIYIPYSPYFLLSRKEIVSFSTYILPLRCEIVLHELHHSFSFLANLRIPRKPIINISTYFLLYFFSSFTHFTSVIHFFLWLKRGQKWSLWINRIRLCLQKNLVNCHFIYAYACRTTV